jgi:hypothetical protein
MAFPTNVGLAELAVLGGGVACLVVVPNLWMALAVLVVGVAFLQFWYHAPPVPAPDYNEESEYIANNKNVLCSKNTYDNKIASKLGDGIQALVEEVCTLNTRTISCVRANQHDSDLLEKANSRLQ